MTNTTITFETIKAGRSQFNASSAKVWRDTIAKWHNADFEIADEINKITDFIKSRRGNIQTNQDIIADPKRQSQHQKRRDEIAVWEADIKRETDTLNDFKKAQKPRLDAGLALVSDNLYNAYSAYAADPFNGELRNNYVVAIAQWLQNHGIEPRIDTCVAMSTLVGQGTNSAKKKFETSKHNRAQSKGVYAKLFLGGICDMLGDAIPCHKFQYVPQALRAENKNK